MNTAPSAPAGTSSGGVPWALGLLVLLCLPFVSSVVASVAMIISGLVVRRSGPLAAENGTRAANWGATYLLLTVVAAVVHFSLLFGIPDDDPVKGRFLPIELPITLWLVLSVVHVVVSIAGLVRASDGRVLRVPSLPVWRVPSA